MSEYLQVSQVAERLSVRAEAVRTWIAKGELKAVDVSMTSRSKKPRLRVLESDLENFLLLRSVGVKTQRTSPEKSREIPQIV